MCGLIGVVGNVTKQSISFFKQALAANVVRGWDSTGVACITKTLQGVSKIPEYTLWSHKDVVTGSEAASREDFVAVFDDLSNTAIMGHNRAATIGQVTANNAHPFSHGGISLMHNGTLTCTEDLDGDFDTDSEQIAYTISRTDDVKSVLEKIEGAFALSWLDIDSNSFNLARNDERPLYYALSSLGNTLYYASEDKMLDWLLSRNKVVHSGIEELPIGEWWSIPLRDKNNLSPLIIDKTEFTPLDPYKQTSYWNFPSYPSDVSYLFGDIITFTLTEITESGFKKGAYNIVGNTSVKQTHVYIRGYSFPEKDISGFKVGDIIRGVVNTSHSYSMGSTAVYLQPKAGIDLVVEENNTITTTSKCDYCYGYTSDELIPVEDMMVCHECVDEVQEILDIDKRVTPIQHLQGGKA